MLPQWFCVDLLLQIIKSPVTQGDFRHMDAQDLSTYAREKIKDKHKQRERTFPLTVMWLHPYLWYLNSLCSCKFLSCLLGPQFLVILYKLHHRRNASERSRAIFVSYGTEEFCITASAQTQINVIPECSTCFLRASSQLPWITHQGQVCFLCVLYCYFLFMLTFAFWDLIGYSCKTPQLLL